ncbi:MAG: tRNA-dihydrouridine synthase, partial [Phycisphaerae bacterium]|nr:tRNA-dihydrouridine synthase [Phycisphaerae bacterium]
TVGQRYRGRADWKVISDVKRRFPELTIIGSGDLFTAEDVAMRISQEMIDGVIIARGAIGNPWIFNEAAALIEGKEKPENPDLLEQKRVICRHLDLVVEHYNSKKAVAIFRKFSAQYVKRHPQRKKVLFELITAKTVEEVKGAIDKWYGPVVCDLSD